MRWVYLRKRLLLLMALILFGLLLLSYLPDDSDQPKKYSGSYFISDYYGDKYAFYDDEHLGNYETRSELNLNRPGDAGKAYKLPKGEDVDIDAVKDAKAVYGINLVASERIPMDRTVGDLRHYECQSWHYAEQLPTVSVVIVFYNEGLSTLMRTVHSVLVGSPQKFLREVILVDDFSDKEALKEPLDRYIAEHFGEYDKDFDPHAGRVEGETLSDRTGKVRVIRNQERQGLINSRSTGALQSVGDVLVFLDGHCEVNYAWLPPLLAPIARNRKTLTVPIIDSIDPETFNYHPVYQRNDQHFKGIWEWGLFYKEQEVDMTEHLKSHKVSEPYDSPTHAGGLFAIDRQYFLELGLYDSGLLVWGGENFELSFKVWQCGGRLQWVPCSRVGHIYRHRPYSLGSLANKRKAPLTMTNYKRVIEVWWDDEYKEYFYTREPMARFYDPGDITEQIAIRDKLECKSFDWFMKNVAYEVFKPFPKLPPNVKWGEVRNGKTRECLDSSHSSPPAPIRTYGCHNQGGSQLFRLNAKGQLGVGERCVDASTSDVTLIVCPEGRVDGPWKYDATTHQMKHTAQSKCLDKAKGGLRLARCSANENQQWYWKQTVPSY